MTGPDLTEGATESGEIRLTVMTRPGCHLCDVAKEALARISAATGERWVEVDITDDSDLEEEYGIRVPVILLDGREHGYWRVEEERLLRDLATPRAAGSVPTAGLG
jgi:glutaredoxin